MVVDCDNACNNKLRTDLAGLVLHNPVILAAGPGGNTGKKLKLIGEKGKPGALTTKAIRAEGGPSIFSPKIARVNENLLVGLDIDQKFGIQQWVEEEFPIALKAGLPIIANIKVYEDFKTTINIAVSCEKAGANVIELDLGSPVIGTQTFLESRVAILVDSLKQILSVPVAVKIPYLYPPFHLLKYVEEILNAGADIIVTVGTLAGTSINIEKRVHSFSSFSGTGCIYGSTKPMSLAIVQTIADKFPEAKIIGTGGVLSGIDVIEYVMAGASAVGLMTGAMLQGPKIFKNINKQIEQWLNNHNVASIIDLKGKALKEINKEIVEIYLPEINPDLCNGCGKCVIACEMHSYSAKACIKINSLRKAELYKGKECAGCGWCSVACPRNSIMMR